MGISIVVSDSVRFKVSGVTDEAGQSMPFSPDSARQLLNMPGLASLAHATYLREVGAKEKN